MQEKDDNEVKRALRVEGISKTIGAKMLGMTYPPFKDRLDEPDGFTLSEFFSLYRELGEDGREHMDRYLDSLKA